jgi:hypothetical protein
VRAAAASTAVITDRPTVVVSMICVDRRASIPICDCLLLWWRAHNLDFVCDLPDSISRRPQDHFRPVNTLPCHVRSVQINPTEGRCFFSLALP